MTYHPQSPTATSDAPIYLPASHSVLEYGPPTAYTPTTPAATGSQFFQWTAHIQDESFSGEQQVASGSVPAPASSPQGWLSQPNSYPPELSLGPNMSAEVAAQASHPPITVSSPVPVATQGIDHNLRDDSANDVIAVVKTPPPKAPYDPFVQYVPSPVRTDEETPREREGGPLFK
jgi:hypothetical protein